MCGITGLFSTTGLGAYRAMLQSANDIVAHRGPDGEGLGLFNTREPQQRFLSLSQGILPEAPAMQRMNLALGHRRLAILDLSPAGLQPMANEDEMLWIVFNGEIYNYLELRVQLEQSGHKFRSHSDTEVI